MAAFMGGGDRFGDVHAEMRQRIAAEDFDASEATRQFETERRWRMAEERAREDALADARAPRTMPPWLGARRWSGQLRADW